MIRVAITGLVALGFALTGCQQAKLSATPPAARANYATPAAPVRGGVVTGGPLGGGTVTTQGTPTTVVGSPQPQPVVYPNPQVVTNPTGPSTTGPIVSNPGTAPVTPQTVVPTGAPTMTVSNPGGPQVTPVATVPPTMTSVPVPATPVPVAPAPSAPVPVATTVAPTPSAPTILPAPVITPEPAPLAPAPVVTSTAATPLTQNIMPAVMNNMAAPQLAAPQPLPTGANWMQVPQPLATGAQFCATANGICPSQQYLGTTTTTLGPDCRFINSSPACQPPAFPTSASSPKITTAAAPVGATRASIDVGCKAVPLSGQLSSEDLDILLVMDTSASMRGGHENGMGGELGMILPKMSAFVDQLDPNLNIRIGMILGHGPATAKSPHNIHGKLFTVAGDKNDPEVIDYKELRARCGGDKTAVKKCVNDKVSAILRNKMVSNHLPNDYTDAEGEALFLSLHDALTEPKLLRNMMARTNDPVTGMPRGLFRKNAYLAVIFFSDEQEVCFDYNHVYHDKEHPNGFRYQPRQVKFYQYTRGKDGKQIAKLIAGPETDPHETRTFDTVCKLPNGDHLSSGHIWDDLLKLKGGDDSKLIVNGVHYLTNDVPKNLQDDFGEMEMGHGYLELIGLAGGQVADMATVDRLKKEVTFPQAMGYLGKYAAMKMKYNSNFQCLSNVHPNAINPTTAEVDVYDYAQKRVVARFSGKCIPNQPCFDARGQSYAGPVVQKINATGQGEATNAIFSVLPDQLNDTLQASGFTGGEVRITFNPFQGVDPNTAQVRAGGR